MSDPTPAEVEAGGMVLAGHLAAAGHPDAAVEQAHAAATAVLRATVGMIERRAQIPLLSLIADLADVHPCWFDHGGFCQEHGAAKPCPHERAQRVLAKARADGTIRTEGDDDE